MLPDHHLATSPRGDLRNRRTNLAANQVIKASFDVKTGKGLPGFLLTVPGRFL